MAKGQVSISVVGEMANVLAEAHNTFPDAQKDSQALTRALFHWYHDRQDNSKRGALRRLEVEVARQGHILQMICDRLGIDTEVIDGAS